MSKSTYTFATEDAGLFLRVMQAAGAPGGSITDGTHQVPHSGLPGVAQGAMSSALQPPAFAVPATTQYPSGAPVAVAPNGHVAMPPQAAPQPAPQPPAPPAAAKPRGEPAPGWTEAHVNGIAKTLSDKHGAARLKTVLQSFQVTKVKDLDPSQWHHFYAACEQQG